MAEISDETKTELTRASTFVFGMMRKDDPATMSAALNDLVSNWYQKITDLILKEQALIESNATKQAIFEFCKKFNICEYCGEKPDVCESNHYLV